jgi:hypothetical protein
MLLNSNPPVTLRAPDGRIINVPGSLEPLMGVSFVGLLSPPASRGPAHTMRLFIRTGDEFGMYSSSSVS